MRELKLKTIQNLLEKSNAKAHNTIAKSDV